LESKPNITTTSIQLLQLNTQARIIIKISRKIKLKDRVRYNGAYLDPKIG
jgi:hypothetical protein